MKQARTGKAEAADRLLIRCRRLGHEVTFHYCRTQEGATVCPLIRDCWWQRLDIDACLARIIGFDRLAQLQAGGGRPDRIGIMARIVEEHSRKDEGGAKGNREGE